MLSTTAMRRPRVGRRAREVARRAPAGGWARARIVAVLADCPLHTRRVAALMLIERLTVGETAAALGVPARSVARAHAALLARLRDALSPARLPSPRRAEGRARIVEIPPFLRKAS